jgi:hypothetical protein
MPYQRHVRCIGVFRERVCSRVQIAERLLDDFSARKKPERGVRLKPDFNSSSPARFKSSACTKTPTASLMPDCLAIRAMLRVAFR